MGLFGLIRVGWKGMELTRNAAKIQEYFRCVHEDASGCLPDKDSLPKGLIKVEKRLV
jgi:hypothetical protein